MESTSPRKSDAAATTNGEPLRPSLGKQICTERRIVCAVRALEGEREPSTSRAPTTPAVATRSPPIGPRVWSLPASRSSCGSPVQPDGHDEGGEGALVGRAYDDRPVGSADLEEYVGADARVQAAASSDAVNPIRAAPDPITSSSRPRRRSASSPESMSKATTSRPSSAARNAARSTTTRHTGGASPSRIPWYAGYSASTTAISRASPSRTITAHLGPTSSRTTLTRGRPPAQPSQLVRPHQHRAAAPPNSPAAPSAPPTDTDRSPRTSPRPAPARSTHSPAQREDLRESGSAWCDGGVAAAGDLADGAGEFGAAEDHRVRSASELGQEVVGGGSGGGGLGLDGAEVRSDESATSAGSASRATRTSASGRSISRRSRSSAGPGLLGRGVVAVAVGPSTEAGGSKPQSS